MFSESCGAGKASNLRNSLCVATAFDPIQTTLQHKDKQLPQEIFWRNEPRAHGSRLAFNALGVPPLRLAC
jgi:hypothetical protein